MTTSFGERPSAAVRLWLRWRGVLLVAAANVSVAATIALVTAVLALVVEDLLPVGAPRQFSGLRWTILAAALALLVTAILWRTTVHRHSGTLFYLRLLDHTMNDWHVHAVDLASRRRMALRPVTRWVDLGRRTHAGTINVIEPCAEISAELRSVVLANPTSHGSTLAPNLLWPMALAIGAELPPVTDLTLLELPGPHADRVRTEVTFTPPTRPASPGLAPDTLGIEDLAAMPGHHLNDGRLGLLLAFGPSAQHMDPRRVFAPFGVGAYFRIRPSWVGVDLTTLIPGCFNSTQLALLAQALTEHIAQLKKTAGTRELVIAAALPKSLAVALGFGLAQTDTPFFAGTHLLHYDSDTQSYLRMRVHPSQPQHGPSTTRG